MSRLSLRIIAVVIGLTTSLSIASAQTRVELLTRETIPGVDGLQMLTIRDNQLSVCYMLFILQPTVSPALPAPTAVQTDSTQQSVQRVREAAERHDRQVGELKKRFQAQTGRPYEMWPPTTTTGWYDASTNYESDRKKIDDEYEHVLRTEMPGSYPWSVLTPGMRTGGWEDAAEAMRRSITNPDPRPFADSLNTQLGFLFQRLAEAPRMTVSGPVPCVVASK